MKMKKYQYSQNNRRITLSNVGEAAQIMLGEFYQDPLISRSFYSPNFSRVQDLHNPSGDYLPKKKYPLFACDNETAEKIINGFRPILVRRERGAFIQFESKGYHTDNSRSGYAYDVKGQIHESPFLQQ